MRAFIAMALTLVALLSVCAQSWAIEIGETQTAAEAYAERQKISPALESPKEKAKREAYLKENTFEVPRQSVKTWVLGGRVITTDSGKRAKSKNSTATGQLLRLDPEFIYLKMKDGTERSVPRGMLTKADKAIVDRLEKQASAKPDTEK